MAFQGKQPFFAFLQRMAAGTALQDAAPAENYILEERLPASREEDFLSMNSFATAVHTKDLWFEHHTNYAKSRVALPPVSETFSPLNRPNWLGLSPDWDVVRLETLYGLCERAKKKGSDVDEAEAMGLIRKFLDARETGTAFDLFQKARLEKWLGHVNKGSDQRPAFVASFADVESILNQADWANRLRNALGLGHIRPWAGNPMTVVLMQYNLVRVHHAHLGKPAWAASPTVLDDVPGQMPNPCFFPAPTRASTDGFGFTVDLAEVDASYQKEFLHGHIAYTLDDICRIGEVNTGVPDARVTEARDDHRGLLASDLQHFSDLPRRP